MHGFRRVAARVIDGATAGRARAARGLCAGVNAGSRARRAAVGVLAAAQRSPRRGARGLGAGRVRDVARPERFERRRASWRARSCARRCRRQLFAFLHPLGTEWDAPIVGGTWRAPRRCRAPEIFDLRAAQRARCARCAPSHAARHATNEQFVGSNSWAVAGTHAAGGAALLANDMHLGLRLPNIWYRARLIVERGGERRAIWSASRLPGSPCWSPAATATSPGASPTAMATGPTSSIVEPDPRDAARYLTPTGSEPFEHRDEIAAVHGGDAGDLRRAEHALGSDRR